VLPLCGAEVIGKAVSLGGRRLLACDPALSPRHPPPHTHPPPVLFNAQECNLVQGASLRMTFLPAPAAASVRRYLRRAWLKPGRSRGAML
jgi:hypothetical protein